MAAQPTPRTDAHVFWTPCIDNPKVGMDVVAAEVSRALEVEHAGLVEALDAITDQLERVGDSRKDAPFIEGARAALAKARGE